MLAQIDRVFRALAVLSDCDEERVMENFAQCEDEWGTLLVFLDCPELKRELDRQARLENPAHKILDGDTATGIRAILSAA